MFSSESGNRRGQFPPYGVSDEVSAEAAQAQLGRILASAIFVRSERLRRFLQFTVQELVQGRAEQLKEYLIGVEVFDRDSGYDPVRDPIVRVEAHRLRSKLQKYYQTEGLEDHVLIEYPKGAYVPVFRIRGPSAVEADAMRSGASAVRCPSIAVLPFADLSPEKDQACLCCGIADALIAALTQLEALRVVSRTSAFQCGFPGLLSRHGFPRIPLIKRPRVLSLEWRSAVDTGLLTAPFRRTRFRGCLTLTSRALARKVKPGVAKQVDGKKQE